MASGESLKVRPSKIVAGHEADRTNEFLQALSLLITNKVSWWSCGKTLLTIIQVDCSDAIQKVLKGEKAPEKERRKRLACLIMLLNIHSWYRPAVAEQSKSKPSDKSKQQSSGSTASKPAERKEKQPTAANGAGSGTNITAGSASSHQDDKKVDTVQSRPKAADRSGRKDPTVQ